MKGHIVSELNDLAEFVIRARATAQAEENDAAAAWNDACQAGEPEAGIEAGWKAYDAAVMRSLSAAATARAVLDAIEAFRPTVLPEPAPEDWTPIWVCSDCQWVEANGGPNETGPLYEGSPVPLNEIPVGARIVAGLTVEHHWKDCSRDDRASGVCTCETEEISSRRCDGCGSTLDGYRHGYMLVTPAEVETP